MTTLTNKHLVMTLDEQYAIVNALAFYHAYHSSSLDGDQLEQFRLAFKEDASTPTFVDDLATKIANIY